jgi:GNAT superfamily N-acetyltransferase
VRRPLPELDFRAVRLVSLDDRPSKVGLRDFAKPLVPGATLAGFAQGLPDILAASDLKAAARAVARAVREGRTVMLAMGGHPIKVGLGPMLADLLARGILSSVSANGSVMVHDSEVALAGATSEDVAAGISSGDFGVTAETGRLINMAAARAAADGRGLGRALGEALIEAAPPFLSASVAAAAARLDVPMTVHVALGTDVYHIHPDCDGAALGRATMDDFRLFCRLVATLEGGVLINLGSAVIMPEVFLKALTLVRNLGHPVRGLTTVNLDFIRQYRTQQNVVERPTLEGGRGYHLTGHHEIMFPLLMGLVLDQLSG